jgi:hypothetical protein
MNEDATDKNALRISADDPADLEELKQLLGSLRGTSAEYRAAARLSGTLGGGELLEVVVGALGGAPISAVLVAWIRSKSTRIQLEVNGAKLKLTSDNMEKARPQVESLIAALNGAVAGTSRQAGAGADSKPSPTPTAAPTPDAIDG